MQYNSLCHILTRQYDTNALDNSSYFSFIICLKNLKCRYSTKQEYVQNQWEEIVTLDGGLEAISFLNATKFGYFVNDKRLFVKFGLSECFSSSTGNYCNHKCLRSNVSEINLICL